MRNPSLPLTTGQARTVALVSFPLWHAISDGKPRRVEYVKRDGTPSASTGVILPTVLGRDSTLAVSVDDPNKGYAATVNVWAITGIWTV